jgi:hypothetical protein
MRSEAMLKRVTLAALCLAVAGCAGMSDTEQRALTGTAAGAAGGAVVGAIAGNTAMGAAIGAGAASWAASSSTRCRRTRRPPISAASPRGAPAAETRPIAEVGAGGRYDLSTSQDGGRRSDRDRPRRAARRRRAVRRRQSRRPRGRPRDPVTVDNFIRAATDIEFGKYVALAGGVNQFYHFRDLMPVDAQTTISANRDTLYSTAIIDISEGATFTLPDVGDRYMSAMVINQDHYLNEVFHGGGAYTLDTETFDTALRRGLSAHPRGCDRPRGLGRRARDPGPDVHRGRLVRTLHRPAL